MLNWPHVQNYIVRKWLPFAELAGLANSTCTSCVSSLVTSFGVELVTILANKCTILCGLPFRKDEDAVNLVRHERLLSITGLRGRRPVPPPPAESLIQL